MAKFRKRPVVIDAWKAEIDMAFPDGAAVRQMISPSSSRPPQWEVFDKLHDTWVSFDLGDWLVCGIQGEFYPVKWDVFAQTYEAVEE